MTSNLGVFGLYRSGTTFMNLLLLKNMKMHSPAYKHMTYEHENNLGRSQAILIYKNPLKWVDSLVRRSWDLIDYYDVAWEYSHTEIFINYDDPENPGLPVMLPASVEKLCKLYKDWWCFWAVHEDRVVGSINHRNLVVCPEKTLAAINPNIEWDTNVGEIPRSRPFTQEVVDYYRDAFLTENLTPTQEGIVRSECYEWI